jgi:hypothetical protein
MNEVLWTLPVPASALTRAPAFLSLGRRSFKLVCNIEADDGEKKISLLFEGVEAFKCTYISSCTPEMINIAYGKLVRLEGTPWLDQIASLHSTEIGLNLKHLMICFDDGPCYEFICLRFAVL